MTDDEQQEYHVLDAMNEHGCFAIQLGYMKSEQHQWALERLQCKGWITLIDVSPISTITDVRIMFRIFMATPTTRDWYRQHSILEASHATKQ